MGHPLGKKPFLDYYFIWPKYLYQYKPVLEGIYMIYLSLNCECQLHYWASSRASYHLQGKYRLPDLYGAYCINFTWLKWNKNCFQLPPQCARLYRLIWEIFTKYFCSCNSKYFLMPILTNCISNKVNKWTDITPPLHEEEGWFRKS